MGGILGTPLPLPQKKYKSEVSKRGWRTEGVGARKPLPCRRFGPFSCTLFLCALYEQEKTTLGDNSCCILGAAGRQPPPPNPFSKPLNVLFAQDVCANSVKQFLLIFLLRCQTVVFLSSSLSSSSPSLILSFLLSLALAVSELCLNHNDVRVLAALKPRVCLWWFPKGGSSFVRRANFPTPF